MEPPSFTSARDWFARFCHRSLTKPSNLSTSGMKLAPTDQLVKLIREYNWDAVRQRILTHPWDAQYLERHNNNMGRRRMHTLQKGMEEVMAATTTLHVAFLYRAPHDIVASLIDVYPAALQIQDSEGWTPLHVNILYKSAEERTTLLVIRRGGYSAASLHSYSGSPLHLACRHETSVAVIQELLRVCPEQVRLRSQSGSTPATILWRSSMRHDATIRGVNNTDTTTTDTSRYRRMLDILDCMIAATEGRDVSTCSPGQRLCLNKVLTFQHRYAEDTNFVRLVLEMYPESAQLICPLTEKCCSCRGENTIEGTAGFNLPLHTAAAMSCKKSCFLGIPPTLQAFLSPHLIVQDPLLQILDAYPYAATLPNHQGRLPLVIALDEGKRGIAVSNNHAFHHVTGLMHDEGGIMQLLQAYPESVTRRDPQTALYPLQIAAAAISVAVESSSSSVSSQDDSKEEEKLLLSAHAASILFQLAIACPHQMMGMEALTSII